MPNDASVLLRAAEALLKASGDLRQAADFAKRAVALTPSAWTLASPSSRSACGSHAAGGQTRARRGARDCPHDDRIVELSKRLK